MTVNELMAHGKNFTEKEAETFFDELDRLKYTEYFDCSARFNGLTYDINKGMLVLYAEDITGDWKHTHICLNSVIVKIAMMNGYDVDVHEVDFFNEHGDWYGCSHVFNLYHSAHKIGICMYEDYKGLNTEHEYLKNWYSEAEKKVA